MAVRLLVMLAVLWCGQLSSISHAADEDFLISSGDLLHIEVYNEPDLTVRAKVPVSGMLKIPLIGDVKVVGHTTTQLAGKLEAMYFDGYLVNPSVSVVVQNLRPFFIRGAVKSAGSYEFVTGLNVDKAIAIAGGLKDRASSSKWFIIRGEEKNRFLVTKDTSVFPGDVIEIEESLF